MGQVGLVGAGDDEHLVGGRAPERAHDHDPLVGQQHPVAGRLLLGDGGAEHARVGAVGEALDLGVQLLGHERDAEQLTVRVLERGTRLPAVVDDGLGVADRGLFGVVLHAVADGGDHQAHLPVVEVGPAGPVVGAEHEHLVDAGARGLVEHRAEVVDGEVALALERRVEVRHDAHQPFAVAPVGLERRRRLLLVPGAERAAQVGCGRLDPRGEVARP